MAQVATVSSQDVHRRASLARSDPTRPRFRAGAALVGGLHETEHDLDEPRIDLRSRAFEPAR